MKHAALDKPPLASLPDDVKSQLAALIDAATTSLGDALAGIVVHGSAVRGGYRPDESDVDVVLILARDDVASLQKIGPALRLARAAARIEGMILLQSEIARSADVFPLLYADIAAHHVCVAGADPFASIVVERAHVRLRVEQELREARIRLRRIVADELDPSRLEGPLDRKVKQMRTALHALATLRGEDGADDLEAVLTAACRRYAIEPQRLAAPTPAADRAAALASLLQKAIDDVDALGHAS